MQNDPKSSWACDRRLCSTSIGDLKLEDEDGYFTLRPMVGFKIANGLGIYPLCADVIDSDK